MSERVTFEAWALDSGDDLIKLVGGRVWLSSSERVVQLEAEHHAQMSEPIAVKPVRVRVTVEIIEPGVEEER